MPLTDPELEPLVSHIKNSFRVHPNHDPVFVDLEGHLDRISSPQNQVIFGRRGSGKSCLLVAFHRHHNDRPDVESIYINADDVKKLSYPDLLVRLLMSILEQLPQRRGILRRPTKAATCVAELARRLDEAEHQEVSEARSERDAIESEVESKVRGFSGRSSAAKEKSSSRTSTFRESKVDYLERHLASFKSALAEGIARLGASHIAIVIDDFYLISPKVQPDVVDYVHRLCRGQDAYFKVATIRHRTQLVRYESGQTVGIEPRQDFEAIDLDQTFEDVERTRDQLGRMLNSMGDHVGAPDAVGAYLSPDAVLPLTLASGGVPRDYLNIFVESVSLARAAGKVRWLTPSMIYKGSAREMYRSKLVNFRQDAGGEVAHLERVFTDLLDFTLREKRKTAFLVDQSEAQSDPDGHEIVRQLMDLKLIHVIVPDTSAASGRPGRYEAYTLDFATFMEPRKRGIEIVEFWNTDEQRRVEGVREAPVYELGRARAVAERLGDADIESAVASLDQELGMVEEGASDD